MSVRTRAPSRRYAPSRWAPADDPFGLRPRGRRVRRVLTIAALLTLIPVTISYVRMATTPSNSSLSVNSVEWLRDNGLRFAVNEVESVYYSLTAPSKGGPPLRALPHQAALGGGSTGGTGSAGGGGSAGGTGSAGGAGSAGGTGSAGGAGSAGGTRLRAPVRVHYYRPPRIQPLVTPALPGEGVWKPTFAPGGGRPPVLVTSFRPDPHEYPQLVAGVAWISAARTSTQLYPGAQEPAVAMANRGPEEVPHSQRYHLVATFNSAFKLADSGGGYAANGHTYAPLRDGMATIVRYRSGRVDIVKWTGGSTAGPGVVWARQNLPLIIDGGRLNPDLSGGPEWGATLGNAALVWRSGVGVDRRGNLLYAAAPDQTVTSLAQILQRAGAVRAMELDINSYWPSFITYRGPGAEDPANLLSDMARSPLRYLTPDDRDFFAVYLK